MILIHHPHDHFFKRSLKERAVAVDFLKAHLPKELYARLDLTTLQAIDKSFVTPALKALHSDIVYQCQIDGKLGYIPILFLMEHQSKADAFMAFWFLQYTVLLMDDAIKAGQPKLPLVLPICVYHGDTSPYPYSTELYDCFEDPALAKQLMFKAFHLIDLTVFPIETLKSHGVASLMEIAFQQQFKHSCIERLKQLAAEGILQHVVNATTPTYLESVIHYALSQGQDSESSVDELLGIFLESLPDKREVIMTFAEQLEQRGLQKGLHQGLQKGLQKGLHQGLHQGKLETAKNMLAQGLDQALIKLVTGLSDEDLVELA